MLVNTLVERLLPARLGASFRWLVASSWTTNLGDGVGLAAGPLLVASLTTDPLLIASAALLQWAPPLLFGLYAGVLSDRLDRRKIVLLANGFRALVLFVLVMIIAAGDVTVATALTALGLLATAEVFADNTSSTLTPMLVSRDDLVVANSRIQTGFIALNQLAGPPIGAALFAAGTVWPFVAQVVVVVAGVLLVSRVVLSRRVGGAVDAVAGGRDRVGAVGVGRSVGMWREVGEGFRFVVGHPAVRTLVLTILIFNVTFGAAWAVLVLYAQQRLGLGAIGYGLLTTVSALGGLIGTASYGWITKRVSLGNIMRIGLIIETFTHLALALTRSAWVAAAVFFAFGAHAFIWGTTSITIRQRAVPEHLQGRVGSVNTICVYGGLVVGSAVGGAIASEYGVTAPFWFAFAGSALFVLLLWRELTQIAHADERAHPAEVATATPSFPS